MSKQNSIDWLFEQIPFEFTSSQAAFEALQIAKEMHKEEIVQACYLQLQYTESELGDLFYKKVPEEIYNENFNNQ